MNGNEEMVDVEFQRPHEHAGVEYTRGDKAKVPASKVNGLIEKGIAVKSSAPSLSGTVERDAPGMMPGPIAKAVTK